MPWIIQGKLSQLEVKGLKAVSAHRNWPLIRLLHQAVPLHQGLSIILTKIANMGNMEQIKLMHFVFPSIVWFQDIIHSVVY